jgi:predicted transcriptional regulator
MTTSTMPRITISLSDRDHLALKLLSLQQEKRILLIAQEAIRQYLDREGAYNLAIRSNSETGESQLP